MVKVIISTNRDSPTSTNHDDCEVVESNVQTFTIHKEHICFYSPYFNRAFNGGFQEAEIQSLRLEDVEPAVFGIVVHWVYHQKFDLPTLKDKEGKLRADYRKLAELWILAQRTLIPALQNHAIDVIFDSLSRPELWEGSNFGDLMELAGENDPTSPLARLAIDTIVYSCSSFFDAQVCSCPSSLTESIIKGLKKHQKEKKSWEEAMRDKSVYYVKHLTSPRIK